MQKAHAEAQPKPEGETPAGSENVRDAEAKENPEQK